MMGYKFFYLYLFGGTIALVLLIYQLIAYHQAVNKIGILLDTIPVVLLYYLAYKVRREKKDKDLM